MNHFLIAIAKNHGEIWFRVYITAYSGKTFIAPTLEAFFGLN
jgi:hypothetical protein